MSENYFDKVKRSVVAEIQATVQGGRNEALNKAAYALGRHAHLAPSSIDSALYELHDAAKSIGLNEIEIKATIGSGFKRGGENPKELKDSDATPYTPSEFQRLIGRLAAKGMLAKDEEARADKIKKAREIWERAVPIDRDSAQSVRPALLYLNSRHIRASSAEAVARFSPNVYDGPAIIFPARNADGEIMGVQAVLLTPDGHKREHNGIAKYSRGVLAGNVMTIGEPSDKMILICEGPEDALSLRQAVGADAAIVCTFGKAGMATYNAPRGSDITICADPDLDVDRVADVLRGDGSNAVHIVRFDQLSATCADANDYLREHGAQKLREALAGAKPIEVAREEAAAAERSWPSRFEWVDPAQIPTRKWIYGRSYVRRFVSVLAAMGGAGKTSLQTTEAISMATGKALIGELVHERVNVWMLNLEDDVEEMQRRIMATCKHYGVKRAEIEGRLFLDAGRDLRVIFAAQTRDGVVIDEALVDYMIEKIRENDIGMVFIDPLVAASSISENDNVAMNALVSAIRGVADATGCAICLTHHIRKANGEEVGVDHIRGAGSLIGAARVAKVLNRVSPEEAMKLGVAEEDATGIMRVDDAKQNLAPPAAKARYARMVGVELGNGESVGVAVPFTLPDLFDGITAADARKVQQEIGRQAETGDPYRESVQAKLWAGAAVAQVLNLDLGKPAHKARAKSVLKTWISTDVLRIEAAKDSRTGREVPAVFVGQWISVQEAGG